MSEQFNGMPTINVPSKATQPNTPPKAPLANVGPTDGALFYDQVLGRMRQYNKSTGTYSDPTYAPDAPAPITNDLSAGIGAGGISQSVDTSAARQSTQNQLGSLDTQLANMDTTAQRQYDELMAQYGEENTANKANFDNQVSTNENTRSGGISQSLAAAAQGGRGLRSTLAAMGALGGTGSILANRAVASAANKDVGGVNETFDTNAERLNTAWGATERDQRQREADATASLSNAKLKNAGSIASQRQNLFKDMAGFWEQAGNKGESANWLSRISEQNPAIEQASLAAVPSFQRSSANFSPDALKNYLAGNQNMAINSSGGNSGLVMNSPLYAAKTRREEYA